MRQQRQALAAAQAELELARQDRVNLEAHRQQLGLWQQQLQHQTQQMQQLQSQFDHARDELRGVKEISTAREMELEKLVTFLKSEMEAAEAQVEELKKLLGTRQEGRRVLP